MGCQSDVKIGDYLTFSICTHDPDTGVLTDADAAPTYRIYEDETAAAILTGTMAKLDDANTTGFYTERVACTAANGFEQGKSYSVYIEATVDLDTGGIAYAFRAYDAWSAATRTLTSTSTAPGVGLAASTWTVLRGDTLERTFATIAADATVTKVQLTVKEDWGDADSAAILAVDSVTGLLYLNGAAAGTYTGTFGTDGELAIPAATMAALTVAGYVYDVQVWRTAVVETIEIGTFNVTNDATRTVTPA